MMRLMQIALAGGIALFIGSHVGMGFATIRAAMMIGAGQ